MSDDTRAQGVMVYPLQESAYDVRTLDRYALGVNPRTGETFLIHTEGVSYRVTHNKPWRFNDFDVSARWYSLKDVRAFPVSAPVDLSEWVRRFGARLEGNFRLAYRALTHESPTDPNHEAIDDHAHEALAEYMPGLFEHCPRGCGYVGRADFDRGWKTHFEHECSVQYDAEFIAKD